MKIRHLLIPALLSLPGAAHAWQAPSADTVEGWIADHNAASEGLELSVRRSVAFPAGDRVRVQQHVDGLPVLNREVILVLDAEGFIKRQLGAPLASPLLDASPSVPEADAHAAAAAFAADTYGTGQLWPPRGELAVFVDRAEQAHLVWSVDVSTADPVGAWRVLVDAHTGRIRGSSSRLHTARAEVYPINPVISDLTDVDLDLDNTIPVGTYANVKSCGGWSDQNGCTDKHNQAEADADGNFYFEPNAGGDVDPLSEIQMYYHLGVVGRWFENELGFVHNLPWGAGQSMEGLVNFDYNNAFYGDADGDGVAEVAFGQTGSIDFAYDGDVVYHEFGHSVFGNVVANTSFWSGDEYGMDVAPGALNEGTADLFSMAITGDPALGEYAAHGFGIMSGAIRDMDEDRHCPTDLYGEAHEDGMIWGSLAWNMMEDERLGRILTSKLIYGALATWPGEVTWAIAGNSVIDTAADMLDEGLITTDQHDLIVDYAERSGVVDCSRVIPLDDGQEPTLLMSHYRFLGDVNMPATQQFSIDAPEGTYRLRFRVKGYNSSDAGMQWNLYVRRGEYVHHDMVPVGNHGWELPTPTDYDFMVEGSGDNYELELLPEDTEHLLEPGATYYFSIASRDVGLAANYAMAEIRVDADVWVEDVPAEEPEPEPEGAGCEGCQSSVASGPTASAVALLPLLLIGRRRR